MKKSFITSGPGASPFLVAFTGARNINIFRNQTQYGSEGHAFFCSYSPLTLQRYFRVLSVNITL